MKRTELEHIIRVAAGGEKDRTIVSAMLRPGVIEGATLVQRSSTLPVAPEVREQIRLPVGGELERQAKLKAGSPR
jgi:hypothetical protein